MKKGNVESAAVRCPFYSTIFDKEVMCEKVTKNMTLGIRFRTEKEKQMYMGMYCNNYYERCKLCKMLMKSYEEG